MIDKYESVLEPNFCTELYESSLHNVKNAGQLGFTSYAWPKAIVRNSAPVIIKNVESREANKIYDQLIQKNIIPSSEGFGCLSYAWTNGSYISWHTDAMYETSITLYLNPEWELNWGGLFLYEASDSELKAVAPKFNTAVLNKSGTSHATSIIETGAPLRMTLQIFKPKRSTYLL